MAGEGTDDGRAQFFVHGSDDEGVGQRLDELAEAHWSYMDAFAARLVARGPTLTPDGASHTGSVHVVALDDIEAARRFALEEPFARAGLYATVTVRRWWNALGGTMWDRPPASPDDTSALVLAGWSVQAAPAARVDEIWATATRPLPPEALVFGGLLLSEDASGTVGLVAALDVALPVALGLVRQLDALPRGASVVTHRWRRGGRPG